MSGFEAGCRSRSAGNPLYSFKVGELLNTLSCLIFFEKTGAFPSYRREKQAGENFIELKFDVPHALNTSYGIKMRLTSMSLAWTPRKERNYRFLNQITASCGQLYLAVKSFLLSPVVIKRRAKGNQPLALKTKSINLASRIGVSSLFKCVFSAKR